MDETVSASNSDSFARIKEYEVWNFMSIEHAKVCFDDRNIINFKGYNDSGKSTMIRALEVCLYNRYPSSQAKFIRDDTGYFRVLVTFEDGVQILKDKYANGKGLYEMYKDGKTIFSTKKDNVLTKITGVPEPIEQYLGLVSYDDIYLNSRSCFEKQLLVETKGKENYNFLNSVLKSEELSVAGTLLNTDKNKLLSEKTRYDAEYDLFSESIGKYGALSTESIKELERIDKNIDLLETMGSAIAQIQGNINLSSQIPDIPELGVVTTEKLDDLTGLLAMKNRLSNLPDIPELKVVDDSRLVSLSGVLNAEKKLEELNKTTLSKELEKVDSDRLNLLASIRRRFNDVIEVDTTNKELEDELKNLEVEISKLTEEAKDFSHKVLRCKNCGALMFDDEMEHAEVC